MAPATSDPTPTSTGTLSPVNNDSSTELVPSTTRPSVAIFSPGRTTMTSPTAMSAASTVTCWPSLTTTACLAPSSINARRADPEDRLARCSSQRPNRTKDGTTAATSKYSAGVSISISIARSDAWPAPPKISAHALHRYAASTPTLIKVSIVVARCRALTKAATWNGHAPHSATIEASGKTTHSQPSKCNASTIEMTATTAANGKLTNRRRDNSASALRVASSMSSVFESAVIARAL